MREGREGEGGRGREGGREGGRGIRPGEGNVREKKRDPLKDTKILGSLLLYCKQQKARAWE